MFSNILLTAGAAGDSSVYLMGQMGVVLIMFVILYFFLIRPSRKQEKQLTQMREALEVGDEVITRGGIIGRIVNLKE